MPEPEGPTIAVDSPAFILNETLFKIFLYSSAAVGYLNETFLNPIDLSILKELIAS